MEAEPHVQARVTREFSAPAESVFDAWLDAGKIGTWMFGPAIRDEEVVALMLEAKVGGAFSFVVRRNGAKISHIGKYQEIARPRHLVFTWGIKEHAGDNSLVRIDIVEKTGGCALTLTHEMPAQWADYVTQVEGAWSKMLDALAKSLA